MTSTKWNNMCYFFLILLYYLKVELWKIIQKVILTFIISVYYYRIDMLNRDGISFIPTGFVGHVSAISEKDSVKKAFSGWLAQKKGFSSTVSPPMWCVWNEIYPWFTPQHWHFGYRPCDFFYLFLILLEQMLPLGKEFHGIILLRCGDKYFHSSALNFFF